MEWIFKGYKHPYSVSDQGFIGNISLLFQNTIAISSITYRIIEFFYSLH